MQSWHTFFWAARFVISWLENFKAIVWSDQKFFDNLIKNMQWRAKSAKIEPFSEIFWVPHTKKFQKGVICNLIFRRCSLYPKINANQHFRSHYSNHLVQKNLLVYTSSIPKNQCKSAFSFHSFFFPLCWFEIESIFCNEAFFPGN